MSLEFNKLVTQVQTMGRFMGQRDRALVSRIDRALEMFYAASDLDAVRQRIKDIRASSVSGYRGATALDEVICDAIPPAETPDSATLVAVDGSQIYPDQHAPTLYYLLNLGTFTVFYGDERIPTQTTEPQMFYTEADVNDADGRLVSNLTVNARRTAAEIRALAQQAWALRDDARPIVTLHDGGLLKFFGATEVVDAAKIKQSYFDSLRELYDVRAVLAGYIDKPRSTYIISLLHLLSLEPDAINDFNLKTNGELEGLTDAYLLSRVLKPGERSAIMVQNSPQNHEYKLIDPNFEIGFFYVNVTEGGKANIARVDIPMWVARDLAAVDALHGLILAQCAIQGRRHYPYALTRADELAYISGIEKAQVNEMIAIELLKQDVEGEASGKLQTKGLARGDSRQRHKIGSRA